MCDLPATPTLDALRESGVVRVRRSNVSLIDAAYVPRSGLRERLDIMARDAAEVIRLLVHNVTAGRGRRMLQRKASYDNIGARSLPRLRPVLEEHAMHALYAADRALAETDRDRRPDAAGGRRSRVAFGVYVLEEPADTESEQEEPS